MNALTSPQRIAIVIGLGCVVLLGLFPPWKVSGLTPPTPPVLITNRYALFSPPSQKGKHRTDVISITYEEDYTFTAGDKTHKSTRRRINTLSPDYSRLLTEWAIVAAITAAVVLSLHRRPDPDED